MLLYCESANFLQFHVILFAGLFPLAFAIVNAENQDSWMWFLSQLLKGVGSGRRLTYVADRQHGLLDALAVVFPNAHHAYC